MTSLLPSQRPPGAAPIPLQALDALRTRRLALRRLAERDRPGFRALHADPRVTAWLSGPLTEAEADALFDRLAAAPAPLAVEAEGRFIGLCGLAPVAEDFPAHAPGAAEILWRLAPAAWGHGYATEAARAWLDRGFRALRLREIRAWTAARNHRSRAVMHRIGMQRHPELDFQHPDLPKDHALSTHVVFCMQRHSWQKGRS